MDFFDFEWSRDEAGYRIETDNPRQIDSSVKTVLSDLPPSEWIKPNGGPLSKVRVLDHFPSLFLKFANTPPTRDAVIKFANSFGLLRGDKEEALTSWYQAIDHFKEAVEYKKEEFWDSSTNGMEISMPRSFSTVLVRQDGEKLPSLFFRPTSLYAAMWLQYAQWVSAPGVQFRSCVWCGELFLYGPTTGRRSSARYCEPRCQKAHNYSKRKELLK